MADDDIELHVKAKDDASDVLDDVADSVEDLEDTPWIVKVQADIDQAQSETEQLQDRLDDLESDTTTVDVDTTSAVAAFDKLDDAARRSEGGAKVSGSAVADLAGPLGDAEGAASTAAGVFDGLGDLLEGMGPRIGLSTQAISGLTTALPIAGVAVAGVAAAWSYFSTQQKKAKEEAQRFASVQKEINELVSEGKFEEAARKLVEEYGDLFDSARKAKLPMSEIADVLTGQADAAATLEKRYRDVTDALVEARNRGLTPQVEALGKELAALQDVRNELSSSKSEQDSANESLARNDQLVDLVTGKYEAYGAAAGKAGDDASDAAHRAEAAMDRLQGSLDMETAARDLQVALVEAVDTAGQNAFEAQGDVLALQQSILDTAVLAHANPVEVKAAIDKLTAGDAAGAVADAQSWLNRNPLIAGVTVRAPTNLGSLGASAGSSAVTNVTNVSVNMPRGARFDPGARAAVNRFARRNGGRTL